jgi:integrase
MRQGELFGLQWPDVNFESGRVTINRALHRTKRKRGEERTGPRWIFRLPKNSGSRRTIEIPLVALEALQENRRRQREMKLLADTDWHEGDLVFASRTGTPLDTSNVLRHFQQILQEAELPRLGSASTTCGIPTRHC